MPKVPSGSTLVAAGRLGLPCVGIEQDEETVGAMVDRSVESRWVHRPENRLTGFCSLQVL